jgi:hypothetical protein
MQLDRSSSLRGDLVLFRRREAIRDHMPIFTGKSGVSASI